MQDVLPDHRGDAELSSEVCPGRAATRKAMWVHFFHRNVRDTVIILEEGPPPPTQILYLDIKVLV